METNMKNRDYKYSVIALITALVLVMSSGCKKDFDELELATYPKTAEVFIDGFSAGLSYAAFGGSKVTAFDVDEEVKYLGTASMRFEVPDYEDPEGGYAGGAYVTDVGRDLSGYDALTFWAKASCPKILMSVKISSLFITVVLFCPHIQTYIIFCLLPEGDSKKAFHISHLNSFIYILTDNLYFLYS